MALSLRSKLMLWFLAMFAVVQIALSLGVVLFQLEAASSARDESLRDWTRAVARRLAATDPPWSADLFEAAAPIMPRFAYIVVYDERGRIVQRLGTLQEDHASLRPSEREPVGRDITLHNVDAETASSMIGERHALRVARLTFQSTQGRSYHLEAAVRDGAILDMYLNAMQGPLLLIPISLLAGAIAGWFLAGRAVAPFREMSEAARHVSPENIDQGIHVQSKEMEIQRLEEELNNAIHRLEAGYDAHERFITNVAHELKTPIAVLLTEAQMLQSAQATDDDYDHFVTSVEEEMGTLGKLVESFLILARTDHGEALANQEIVPVNDIVIDSVQHCGAFAEQFEVRLIPNLLMPENCDFDPELLGDQSLLRTMVDNLIRNAVRFSPPEGVIEITCDCREEHAIISVRDHGSGIPDDQLEKIFDRFAQVDGDASRRRMGTGLGLAIAKGIAELHGGRICARNAEDGGAIFEITLPLTPIGEDGQSTSAHQ